MNFGVINCMFSVFTMAEITLESVSCAESTNMHNVCVFKFECTCSHKSSFKRGYLDCFDELCLTAATEPLTTWIN